MILDDDLVSVALLADLLDIAPSTLRQYSSQRLLPPILGGLLPLRASVQMHVRRMRVSAKRGRCTGGMEPPRSARADVAAVIGMATAVLNRIAADVDRSEPAQRLASVVAEAAATRMDRAALSQDGEMRDLLVGLAGELRAEATKMIEQGEEVVDG